MNINCQPPLQFVYFSTDTHIPWISHNTLRDRLFKNGVAIRKKVYYDLMPAIALLVKESLSWLIKVVTTPRNIELDYIFTYNYIFFLILFTNLAQ